MDTWNEYEKLLHCYENKSQWIGSLPQEVSAVGTVGGFVPCEYIAAAGFVPAAAEGIAGDYGPLAQEYLENVFKDSEKALFQAAAGGSLPPAIKYIVFSNTSDASIKLYYYLRELSRRGNVRVPPLYLIDWRFGGGELNEKWNREELARFVRQLQQWCGSSIDGARLEQAFNLYAEQRRAVVLAAGLTRRTPPLISAEQMLVIAQSVGYMDPARHAELTFGLCRRAQEAGTGISGRRAVYFGTVPVTTGYFEVLRAQGFAVVDSDIWDQMEPPGGQIEDFSAAAVRRVTYSPPAAKRALPLQRAQYITDMALACGAEVVVCYAGKGDDGVKWDIPAVSAALEQHGIRLVKTDEKGRVIE